jgi:hypothetical protein
MEMPRKMETNSWFPFHDNAPAHRSVLVKDFLAKNNVTTLKHTPYLPDLSSADFYTFPRLKSALILLWFNWHHYACDGRAVKWSCCFVLLRNNVIPKTFCSYHGCGLVCVCVCMRMRSCAFVCVCGRGWKGIWWFKPEINWRCNVVQCDRNLAKLRRNLVPPSSG